MTLLVLILIFIGSICCAYAYGYILRGTHEKKLNDRRKVHQHEIWCDINRDKIVPFSARLRQHKVPQPPKWADLSNVTYNPNCKSIDEINIPKFMRKAGE